MKHYIIVFLLGILYGCKDKHIMNCMRQEGTESHREIETNIGESQISLDPISESLYEPLYDNEISKNKVLLTKILEYFNNESIFQNNKCLTISGYILGAVGELRNYTTGLKFGKTFCSLINLNEEYKIIFGMPIGVTSFLTHAALSADSTSYHLNEIYRNKCCPTNSLNCVSFVNGFLLSCTLLGGLNFIYPNYVAYDGNITAIFFLGIPSIISTSSYLYKFSKNTLYNLKNSLVHKNQQQVEEDANQLIVYNQLLNFIAKVMKSAEKVQSDLSLDLIEDVNSYELLSIEISKNKKITIASLSALASLCSTTILFLLSEESMLQFLKWVNNENEVGEEGHYLAYTHAVLTSIPWFITNSQAFYNRTVFIIDRVTSRSTKNYYDPNSLLTIPVSYFITAIAAMPWLYLSWTVLDDYSLTAKIAISATSFTSSIFLRGESFRDLLWGVVGGISKVFKERSSFFSKIETKYTLRQKFKKISSIMEDKSYETLLSFKNKLYDPNRNEVI